MRRLCIVLTIASLAIASAFAQNGGNPFAGRWDITLTKAGESFPCWMELVEKGGAPQVRVQLREGHARPFPVKMEGARLIINVPKSGAMPEGIWDLAVKSGKLTGVQKHGDTEDAQIAGVRAPELKRAEPKAWTDPVPLFNGKDLSGWEPVNNTPGLMKPTPAASHWMAKDGELVNESKGSNLRTTRTFNDFKLHIEFNCPAGENSGIYLRGRYETQISPGGGGRGGAVATARGPVQAEERNLAGGLGSVYGYVAFPMPEAKPGEWQSYDITLVGRTVTVVLNGVKGIENEEIPGITGGALDSHEGEPGPLLFQGDHHGGIRYRNITMSVPKR